MFMHIHPIHPELTPQKSNADWIRKIFRDGEISRFLDQHVENIKDMTFLVVESLLAQHIEQVYQPCTPPVVSFQLLSHISRMI